MGTWTMTLTEKIQLVLWLLFNICLIVACVFLFVIPAFSESYKVASFYGSGEKLNKHTANGEVFDPEAMTCAMWNVPFGTKFRVTNIANGEFCEVRCNDRGPAKRLNRDIDLSRGAFEKISNLNAGLIFVTIEEVR